MTSMKERRAILRKKNNDLENAVELIKHWSNCRKSFKKHITSFKKRIQTKHLLSKIQSGDGITSSNPETLEEKIRYLDSLEREVKFWIENKQAIAKDIRRLRKIKHHPVYPANLEVEISTKVDEKLISTNGNEGKQDIQPSHSNFVSRDA